MKFPDPNIGYLFDYRSCITDEGIRVSFLGDLVKITFKFDQIESFGRGTYMGGRISWNVVRWGKCPPGTAALNVILKKGLFRNHLIVFERLEDAVDNLRRRAIQVRSS